MLHYSYTMLYYSYTMLYYSYTISYSYTMHQFYMKCNMTKPKLIQTCSYQTTNVVPTQVDKNARCFTHFCVIY